MLCPSCNSFRPANNAPCPSCNAPSPLVNEAGNGQNAFFSGNQNQAAFAPSWGGPGAQQNDWSGSGAQQMAFPSPPPNFGGSGAQPMGNFGGSGVQQMAFPSPPHFGGSGAQQMAFPSPPPNFGGSGAQPIGNFGGSGAQQMAFPSPPPNFGGSGAQPMGNFGGSGVQQMAQPSDGNDNSFWSQNLSTREARSTGKQQSLLPVPYQGQPGSNDRALSLLPSSFPTIAPGVPQVNSLVPALPDSDQDAPVYVPPMYTKPRPIIPRYRAISGLISVVIVFLLLCGGTGYWAQTTGKLVGIEKLFGVYTPPSITSNQSTLPVPSNQVVQGPAANVVYSVGISNKIDPNTGIIPVEVNQFTVGETIWLACSAKPSKDGTLTVQWYSNGNHYQHSSRDITQKKGLQTATIPIVYGLPTEGKVEVYWNNQLAATVLFVVEPAAS